MTSLKGCRNGWRHSIHLMTSSVIWDQVNNWSAPKINIPWKFSLDRLITTMAVKLICNFHPMTSFKLHLWRHRNSKYSFCPSSMARKYIPKFSPTKSTYLFRADPLICRHYPIRTEVDDGPRYRSVRSKTVYSSWPLWRHFDSVIFYTTWTEIDDGPPFVQICQKLKACFASDRQLI